MEALSKEYWNQRYKDGTTGWDIGQVSPPIKAYVDQLEDHTLHILVPGAGNGHEVRYMHQQGFGNVHMLDVALEPIQRFLQFNGDFPKQHTHVEDLFDHTGQYDLIIEQTLLCAIDPELRTDYAQKVSDLLKKGGKLVGLLFNRAFDGGPPFGGNVEEYKSCFDPYFSSVRMEPCYNSVEPRAGSEVFIQLIR